MKTIAFEEARSVVMAALERAGVPQPHAVLQADLLLEAELRGRASHGLLRLNRIIERIHNGVADPLATGDHRWRGSFLDVDGKRGLGPVVACAALDVLIERARANGIAIGAIRNNNHLGMLAWYADRIARRGLILIALCNSEALVHPWGGRKAMIGTNPIAIGVPTADQPFVLDMATSLVSMGQIHNYANQERPLPPGWALDADGNPTTDAAAAKRGSIAPFGAAKGYALGLAFEVLIGTITGSEVGVDVQGTLDSEAPCNKGDVFIVIDSAADSATARTTAQRISRYLDSIRASGLEGGDQVQVPGDRALAMRRTLMESGLPIEDDVWEKIKERASHGSHSSAQGMQHE